MAHSAPLLCVALYDYQPQEEDELALVEGDRILIHEQMDEVWWRGQQERTGRVGCVPAVVACPFGAEQLFADALRLGLPRSVFPCSYVQQQDA
jgi:hypothetical protein